MRKTLLELNPEDVGLVLGAMWIMARAMRYSMASGELRLTPAEADTVLLGMLALTRALKEIDGDELPRSLAEVAHEDPRARAPGLRLVQSM